MKGQYPASHVFPGAECTVGSSHPMDDSSTVFSQPIGLRWADLDPNGHVRHSVYYDWGAMARVTLLESKGVGLAWMVANSIGPVLFREEGRFLRELRFGDQLTIDVQIGGASAD